MKSGMSSRIRAIIIAKLMKNMADSELLTFIVATTKELERRSELKPEEILSGAIALIDLLEEN